LLFPPPLVGDYGISILSHSRGQQPPTLPPWAVRPPPRPADAAVPQVGALFDPAEEPVLADGLWEGSDGSQPAEG